MLFYDGCHKPHKRPPADKRPLMCKRFSTYYCMKSSYM